MRLKYNLRDPNSLLHDYDVRLIVILRDRGSSSPWSSLMLELHTHIVGIPKSKCSVRQCLDEALKHSLAGHAIDPDTFLRDVARDWCRQVSSWGRSVLRSSCCGTVNYKLACHAIDPDTFLHEGVLCYDHHVTGQWNTNPLVTRLIQIRSFMRRICTLIIMLRVEETQTRCSRDWSRYVSSWGCSRQWSSCHETVKLQLAAQPIDPDTLPHEGVLCLWSSCCRTVKHKLAGHAIDPDTYLHEDVLCYDHHTAAQWNTNSLITRLIQIRSFMRDSVLWLSYCSTVKHKPAGHAIDPNTFLHEGVLCCDHHASGTVKHKPLITLLIQIRSFMRMFSTMIIIRLDSETQTRWPRDWFRFVSSVRTFCTMTILLRDSETQIRWLRDWSRYVFSWGCFVLRSSCYRTVNNKTACHAIDLETFLHEGVLCYDHHAVAQWITTPLVTRLIQIRSFTRVVCFLITMLLDSETQLRWSRDWYRYVLSWRSSLLWSSCYWTVKQTRLSRDWSRYVPSWGCCVLWSSCCWSVKHKLAGHAIDPDTFLHENVLWLWSSCCGTVNYKLSGHAIDADTCLHEEVLCHDHHATGQWNLNSLTTRLIQIRSFMRLFCAVIIMLLDSEHKLVDHAIDPDTFFHEDVLCYDHHATGQWNLNSLTTRLIQIRSFMRLFCAVIIMLLGQWNTNSLITLLIQIRSFMRTFSTMIIMSLHSETQTRWSRDWSRYVPS